MKTKLSCSMDNNQVIPCKVIINSFPSRNEIIQILDDFISNNNHKKDYLCDSKDNSITINFPDSNIAFEFLKIVNSYKLKDIIYTKIKTALIFDAKKTSVAGAGNKSYSLNNSRLYKSTITKANENHKSTEERGYLTEVNQPKYIDRSIYFSKRTPLLIEDPYIDPKALAYSEYEKNKKKWLNPKGFRAEVNSIRIARMNELGTCVTRTEGKYNYKNFIFREDNKKKWLSDKNFSIKHLPEFL